MRAGGRAEVPGGAARGAGTRGRCGLPAARRAGEEDHPVGVSGDVLERPDHARLALAVRARQRHGGPETGIQLAPELLDQSLLVLGHARIALRDQYLAMSRFHSQKAHAQIMSKGLSAAATTG